MEQFSQAELVHIQVLLIQELRRQKELLSCFGSNCPDGAKCIAMIDRLKVITGKVTSMLENE